MDLDNNKNHHNADYWKHIPADKIIGRNAFPGAELFENVKKNSRILDVGCGTGEIAEYVAHFGYEVVGLDINKEAISQNSTRNTKVEYVLGDANERLPFESESFHGVILAFILVNILPSSKRKLLIKEITRILKKDGIIWVNEPIFSKDYEQRYALSRPFVVEEFDTFSLRPGHSFSDIHSVDDMKKTLDQGLVDRIFHHFTKEELRDLFMDYDLIYQKDGETVSPRTKTKINTEILVFRKR